MTIPLILEKMELENISTAKTLQIEILIEGLKPIVVE